MEADASNHPDEGTIHAWLDGALEPAGAARIAEHVRGCAECSARVAEARGLIAGASRIVGALDDVPAGSRPAWSQEGVIAGGAAAPAASAEAASREVQSSLWRRLRVTPARAAIAATLIVALGITLTRQRTAIETPEMVRTAAAPRSAAVADSMAGAGATETSSVAQAREAARQADHLLDSAVAKSVAVAHPQRALKAAPGAAIPQPPAGAASAARAPDTTAGMQVAVGRRAVQAERVAGAAERADKARVGAYAAVTPPAAAEALDAARAAEQRREKAANVAGVAPSRASGAAKQCYLIEGRSSGGVWGGEALPLLVAVDSAARSGSGAAAVYSAAGARTPLQARWERLGRDSLTLSLRRIGYTGAIALGPELAGGRAGIARSAPQTAPLEELVVAGAGEARNRAAARDSQSRAAGAAGAVAKGDRGVAPGAPAAAPAPTALAAPAQPSAAGREYPVTMRPAACPNQ